MWRFKGFAQGHLGGGDEGGVNAGLVVFCQSGDRTNDLHYPLCGHVHPPVWNYWFHLTWLYF